MIASLSSKTSHLVLMLLFAAVLCLPIAADAAARPIARVSVASDGTQGNGISQFPAISADGRQVAFVSRASNLVPGDTNGNYDIFVHDRGTSETSRVSVAADGTEGNAFSLYPAISADGRYVAFHSRATNLVPGDTNSNYDIYVHDRSTGTTNRVSVASDGTQGNSGSLYPALSADGRYVAFESYASNLVFGDANNARDIFIHDRSTGVTNRVSVSSDGTQSNWDSYLPVLSADGRYVAFYSGAWNLVRGDTNGVWDIFVHDRSTGETSLVSMSSDGTQGSGASASPALSADGRYVMFHSDASNLVPGDTNGYADVFVHDRSTGETSRVSVSSDGTQGNGESYTPAISADGRYVAFHSRATNLVPGDTNGYVDIFVHDRTSGTTTRLSVTSGGREGNNISEYAALSADGRYVAFHSFASNLVPGDTNGVWDIFVSVVP